MAHHPWRTIVDDKKALVQWCPYCGAVRQQGRTSKGGGEPLAQVWFPRAYEKVSRTTCALMQDEQERTG